VISPEIVVDTGVLLEYLTGSPAGKAIEKMIILNDYIISILISPLTLVEIYYIFLRKNTEEIAEVFLNKIKDLIVTESLEKYIEESAIIKAETAFALADSCTLGLAEYRQITAIFKHENEIDRYLLKAKDKIHISRIVFIDDFPVFKEIIGDHSKKQ